MALVRPMGTNDEAIERAAGLLMLVRKFMEDTADAEYRVVHYDGADCDGGCFIDDCEVLGEELCDRLGLSRADVVRQLRNGK